jgi:hypothetical protein
MTRTLAVGLVMGSLALDRECADDDATRGQDTERVTARLKSK